MASRTEKIGIPVVLGLYLLNMPSKCDLLPETARIWPCFEKSTEILEEDISLTPLTIIFVTYLENTRQEEVFEHCWRSARPPAL